MNDSMEISRLEALQIDEVLFGLPEDEYRELELLEKDSAQDRTSFEIAATLVELSKLNAEPLPENLFKSLAAKGKNAVATKDLSTLPASEEKLPSKSGSASNVAAKEHIETEDSAVQRKSASKFLPGNRELLAWCLVAASLVIALFAGWQSLKLQKENRLLADQNLELNKQINPVGSELFAELTKQDSPGMIRWSWQAEEESKTTGEVLWDQERQVGVMRFVGFQPNDPRISQYQLWIFDESQEYPIDGGVFDISTDGETFVPIHAKLMAKRPKAFAVTVERPDGVVVSKKELVPLVASAK